MTLLAALRGLADIGGGLALAPAAKLRYHASPSTHAPLSAELRAGIAENRLAVTRAVDPTTLRIRFKVSSHVRLDAALCVVLAWLSAEHAAFTPAELREWLARVGLHLNAGHPRYFAEIQSIEDVVRHRTAARPSVDMGKAA